MKIKKLIGCTLMTITLLGLSACGGGDKAKDNSDFSIKDRYEVKKETPAWKLDKKKENKLTWYINSDWTMMPWGEDVTTAKIKEDLHLDIEFITGDDTKLNSMMASGDMPDIVTLFDSTSQAAKKAPSWALPLDELAVKYDPYFLEVAKEDTMNWFKLEDGHTYGYPNYSNTAADYESDVISVNTNFIIRKDVYEAIGKPSLATPEEFVKAMNDIKTKFPDLVPFYISGEGAGKYFPDWIGVPLEQDGSFYDRRMDEDYLTWIKAFNEVYRNGDMSDDSFADDGPTFDEKLKAGKYAALFINGISGMGDKLQAFKISNPDAAYIPIDGPQSTVGNKPGLSQTGISGWLTTYITKQCKDPAKAIQLFTYLLDPEEGQLLTRFGVEGVTYQYNEDGKIEFLPEVVELKEKDPDAYSKKYRISEFLFFNHDRNNALMVSDKGSVLLPMQEWGKGKLQPHFIIEQTDPDAGTPEARSNDAINKKWDTLIVSMIRAKNEKDFDNYIKEYKDFLGKNNWDDVVKVKDEKMESNRKKLGLDK